MPVRAVELNAIEAKRFTKPNEKMGQVRIDHNSTVTLMSESDTDEAYVEFAYTTSYGPVGLIKMEGALVYRDEKASDLVAQWKETHKMPNEVASKIHTTVMQACVPEAVGLAKTLRMPPPIPLPQVNFEKGGKAKTPAPAGPEFQ